jgi:hypothetical protein
MTPSSGIEPEIAVVRGERLAATPLMLPIHKSEYELHSKRAFVAEI